jgi:predicted O-methyltransferase YrrM
MVNLHSLLSLFRQPHLRGRMELNAAVTPFVRLHFFYVAAQCGLLQMLRTPCSKDKLVRQLAITNAALLDSLLELGIALGELSCANGAYRLRSERSLALVDREGDPLVAMLEEFITFYGPIYQQLGERLRGAPPGDYLASTASIVARSSRLLEPVVASFIHSFIRGTRPMRLLEIGCGSGVYLRYAAESNPQLTGIAIEMQPQVVEEARANLKSWGIADRFDVLVANILRPPPELAGPFDVVTLYNNIYYFASDEHPALFQSLCSRMTPDGMLAMVSIFKSATVLAGNFDLVLRSTQGCVALPAVDEVMRELRQNGFGTVQKTQLYPGESFYGLLARRGK